MKYYEFVHSLGLHIYDLPALLLASAAIISLIVHGRRQKKREEEFENEPKADREEPSASEK